MATQNKNTGNFQENRIKDLEKIFGGVQYSRNDYKKGSGTKVVPAHTAQEIRKALEQAASSGNPESVVELSNKLYAVNPIYMSLISYYSDMFLWRYTITPHILPKKVLKVDPTVDISTFGRINKSDYGTIYATMLEITEGLQLEEKAPMILKKLFLEGAVYFTTVADPDSLTIDTILLPVKYCKKIGDTQVGTSIIKFDCQFFDAFTLSPEDKADFLNTFPEEIQEGYKKYKQQPTDETRWIMLDPHYSSCIMLNEKGLPTLLYTIGSILNYEQYGDNELARNENQLKYIVVHKMPLYQDNLIFETNEVAAIHQSLAKIVNTSDKTRLITTYGDVSIEKIQDTENTENKVLENAYNSIFNNAGLNASIFTGESVQSLRYSVLRDKAQVWTYIEQIIAFYNVAINNWFDFGNYQADIEMLPICQYSYNDDIKIYRDNATLGIGKLDFIVASGVKQKHISDRFMLEDYLKLEQITPLQTSYTQTNADRTASQDKGIGSKSSDDDNKNDKAPSPDVVGDEVNEGQEDKNEKDKI